MKKRRVSFPDCVRHLVLGWLAAALTEYLLLPLPLRDLGNPAGLGAMVVPRFLGVGATVFFLCFLFPIPKQAERWAVFAALLCLLTSGLIASFSLPLLLAGALILALALVYARRGWQAGPDRQPPSPERSHLWAYLAFGAAAVFFLLVSLWTLARVWCYHAPTYDFGIFSQMFYHMKESGLPMTTLERDGMLSHFAVHVSAIYYLMLPFYCLFPTPATLQILQALVMASAALPLWLLARQHGFSPRGRFALCLLLLLQPAFAGGAGYDLHENCFLTPLLFWLFYAVDRKKGWLVCLFAVLTWCVKEDAPVYVAVLGVYQLVNASLRKEPRGLGVGLILGSLLWFLAVTGYLARYGDGVMTDRYNNFLFTDSNSLVTVILAAVLSPLKLLSECVDPEKLSYIALTLLPLLGLPLWTRRYERYVLLIPYMLVNLMSDYQYQHHIFFQYNFGSQAFLLYLTLLNLKDLKHRSASLPALLISLLCFCNVVIPKAMTYPRLYWENRAVYAQVEALLQQIPADSPVAASTFYTVPLSQREILYDVGYATDKHILEAEFVVLHPDTEDLARLTPFLEDHGYTLLTQLPDHVVIYARTDPQDRPRFRGPHQTAPVIVNGHTKPAIGQ